MSKSQGHVCNLVDRHKSRLPLPPPTKTTSQVGIFACQKTRTHIWSAAFTHTQVSNKYVQSSFMTSGLCLCACCGQPLRHPAHPQSQDLPQIHGSHVTDFTLSQSPASPNHPCGSSRSGQAVRDDMSPKSSPRSLRISQLGTRYNKIHCVSRCVKQVQSSQVSQRSSKSKQDTQAQTQTNKPRGK